MLCRFPERSATVAQIVSQPCEDYEIGCYGLCWVLNSYDVFMCQIFMGDVLSIKGLMYMLLCGCLSSIYRWLIW